MTDFIEILKEIGVIVTVGGAVIGGIFTALSFWGNKTFATIGELETLERESNENMEGFRGRLVQLEETVKHQPSMRDIANLESRISSIAVDVAKMTGINQSQTVILEALYNKLVLNKTG